MIKLKEFLTVTTILVNGVAVAHQIETSQTVSSAETHYRNALTLS